MRKCIFLILAIFIMYSETFANDPFKRAQLKTETSLVDYNNFLEETEYSLSLLNVQVDALGILFFGPQVAMDFQFANVISVGPYVRWHYAGLIYQGVVTDWFTDETVTSIASYSYGAQAKAILPVGKGQHRPYFGLGFEKSFGSDSYDQGGTLGERIYEYETNVFHIDLGYRLLTNSSFNLSAGIAVGIAKDTKSIGYNENNESDITNYNLETRILPMVQLVLGWQLGK